MNNSSSPDSRNLELLFPECSTHKMAIDDGNEQLSWLALTQRTSQWLHLIQQEWKLKPHQHIAVLMKNRNTYIECLLASLCAGIWITPVNNHLRENEIRHIINDSGSEYLICDEEHVAIANASQAKKVICVNDDFENILAQFPCEPIDPQSEPGGAMMYTSGTSGLPKGVKRHRAENIWQSLNTMRTFGKLVGVDGNGPHLVTGPLHHAAPGLFALYDLLNGSPLVIMKKWDCIEFLKKVEHHQIRHTHLVPIHFERLLKLPEAQKQSLRPLSLQCVLHGAAPISRQTKQKILDWWGPILNEYWGATETGVITLCNSQQWQQYPGTVGKALPLYDVFSCDDQNSMLDAGEIGTLFARHKLRQQIFSYHNDPVKTAEAQPEDFLVTLGDMGYYNRDSFIFLTDRKHRMIISGGVNIYPAEIEQVFQSHPSVNDIAVFGTADKEWGEQVEAAVVLEKGVKAGSEVAQELTKYGEQSLARFKLPKRYHFVDKLPRSPAGKLIIRYLDNTPDS